MDYLRINTLLTLVLPIFINFYFILKIKKIDDDLKKLSLLCLSILCFTPHQLHDYVLYAEILNNSNYYALSTKVISSGIGFIWTSSMTGKFLFKKK